MYFSACVSIDVQGGDQQIQIMTWSYNIEHLIASHY